MNTHRTHQNWLAIATLLILGQSAAFAQTTAGFRLDPREVEKIVRQYILDNPEVVLESVRLYQERQIAEQKQRSREAVIANKSELNSGPASAGANQPGEPVTIAAFFDYRCGYCKKVEDTVAKLAKTPGVRMVYKEFPILGPESVRAAEAALAAEKQGAYEKFHRALMTSAGPVTPGVIEKIARDLALDPAQLKKDMASPEIQAAIAKNHELAEKLGIQSTPTFVVGNEVVAGALSFEAFRALIDAARRVSKTPQAQVQGGNH